MIKLENVCFSYKNTPVLQDVSLEVRSGSFVGIVGGNGTGKTTLLKLILGLLKPDSGLIVSDCRKISYVLQTTSDQDMSFPASVGEIVASGLTDRSLSLFSYHRRKGKVSKILADLGIEDLKGRLFSELSGGQQQKVKIGKALISDPDLIVLDEPDVGMDEQSHTKMLELISNLHDERKTIIFVTHHFDDLREADSIYKIEEKTLRLLSAQEVMHVSI